MNTNICLQFNYSYNLTINYNVEPRIAIKEILLKYEGLLSDSSVAGLIKEQDLLDCEKKMPRKSGFWDATCYLIKLTNKVSLEILEKSLEELGFTLGTVREFLFCMGESESFVPYIKKNIYGGTDSIHILGNHKNNLCFNFDLVTFAFNKKDSSDSKYETMEPLINHWIFIVRHCRKKHYPTGSGG